MKTPSIVIFSAAMLLFSAAAAQGQTSIATQKPPANVEAIFKSLDRNRDRALSKMEAKANSSIWGQFDKADVNLDGYITKPEYQAYLEVSRASQP
jgi:heat shock protein HslJ